MHQRYLPKNNFFTMKNKQHDALYSSIHKARVTEVFVEDGTVQVDLETVGYSAKVTIPLLGLSIPLLSTGGADWKSSSWGRYMPRVGDVLLVGFESNGTLQALGYSAMYYRGLQDKDNEFVEAGEGGMSWSKSSYKDIKPGDWDFKSGRGSYLYLGDKAKIGSNNCSITANSNTADIVTVSDLFITNAGPSKFLYGSVKRKILPTDITEMYIPSGRGTTTAQEATLSVKWNGSPTGAIDLAYLSFGDVTEMIGGANILKISDFGFPTRKHFLSTDITGYLKTYEDVVDCLGNYYVSANLSTNFQWTTPLAAWKTTNLSTEYISTTSFKVTSLAIDTIGMTTLGGPGALPLVKATPSLLAAWTAYFTAAAAAFTALAGFSVLAPISAAMTTASGAAVAINSQLSASASTMVKGL